MVMKERTVTMHSKPVVRRRPRRWRLAAVAVLGLLLLGGLTWFLTSRRGGAAQAMALTEDLPFVHRVPTFRYYAEATGEVRQPGNVLVPAQEIAEALPTAVDSQSLGWLTADQCQSCHQEKVEGFLQTAHARTSSLPTRDSVLGSFDLERNELKTRFDGLKYRFVASSEEADATLFQEVVVTQEGKEYAKRFPFGLVTGSGNHGQTYLYWNEDRLYQLPISYIASLGRWGNSPGQGQVDGCGDFSRPILARCLECHATYAQHVPNTDNGFRQDTIVTGVQCTRCHGPANAHVAFHRADPQQKQGHAIVHPGKLDRDRANEVCAQCHSKGTPRDPQQAFTYIPGTPLRQYLRDDFSLDADFNADPHSNNQLARMMLSKCYQKSDDLRCASCHDPHRHERSDWETYSARCATCHSPQACPEVVTHGKALEQRCVQCHMPVREDKRMKVQVETGATVLLTARDHKVQVDRKLAEQQRAEILSAKP
jgi:hypothetical protein